MDEIVARNKAWQLFFAEKSISPGTEEGVHMAPAESLLAELFGIRYAHQVRWGVPPMV